MEPLDSIRSRIPNFDGYPDENSRRQSDELIRSYAGEALASLHQAHAEFFSAPLEAQYDRLILRCSFMNQTAFRFFEYVVITAAIADRAAQADAGLLDLADRANRIEASGLPEYLDEFGLALDRRDATATAAGSAATS